MITRFLMRLVVLTAAVSAIAAVPAAAEDCKDPVTATGRPATLRDLGAYPNSLFTWRSVVKDKYGSEFNSWRYAKDRDVDCEQEDGKWVCTRTAKPCKDVLHRVIDGATKKKNCEDEPLSSYGAARSNEDDAVNQAESGWEIDTRKKYGKEWADWDNADDRDIDCHKVKGGKLQCIAVGTACKAD
jgi:hypothetical protein